MDTRWIVRIAIMTIPKANLSRKPWPVDCVIPPKPGQRPRPSFVLICHDEEEFEAPEIPKRSDVLHQQCTQCHLQYGSGPLFGNVLSDEEKAQPNAWIDCNKCHVL